MVDMVDMVDIVDIIYSEHSRVNIVDKVVSIDENKQVSEKCC